METALQKSRQAKADIRVLSDSELSGFCGQMALILGSGLSALEGLSVMLEDSREPGEQSLLQALYEHTDSTGDFSGALEKTGVFPDYLISMVRIGEETGTMDTVMNGLSEHYDREDSMRRSVRNAVTYPLVMVTMMVAVIVVLLVKVMPIFNRVFIQLGSEMTGISRVLMNLGTVISRYSVVLAVLLAMLAALTLWCGKTASGARFAIGMIRKLGVARNLRAQTAACRIADGLALTLGSGLSSDRALELASTLVEDPETAQKLAACSLQVQAGEDMIQVLHDANVFTGVPARLAAIGSRTGSLDQAMRRIAGMYQENIDHSLSSLLGVLEPALVIGISLIVGSILLSVMLPLLGIMSGI